MLSAKRMREHAALFAAVLGVSVIVSGLMVGMVGYLAQAADDGVRASLAERTGAEGGLRISLNPATDPGAQDDRVRALIDAAMRSGDRATPFDVIRQEQPSNPTGLSLANEPKPAESTRVQLLSVPDLDKVATLVTGDWGSSVGEMTMQADAATALGLAVGDRLRIGATQLDLVGTWRVDDGFDPRWMGDSMLTTGISGDTYGPIEVDPAAWTSVGVQPNVDWTLVPRVPSIRVEDLGIIAGGWSALGPQLIQEFGNSVQQDGGLASTTAELGSQLDAVHAVAPSAFFAIGAIGFVTLAELARLLGGVRAAEIALLRSRGASARRIGLTTAGEAAPVSAVGSVLGVALVGTVLVVLFGPQALTVAGPALWAIPLAVVIVSTALLAGQSWLAARRALSREMLYDAGRGRSVVGAGLVALLTIAAAVSVWQFLLYGSPLTPTPGGGTALDPLAVVAPALTLVAIVLLALLLFPVVARWLARLAARGTGVRAPLAARTIARRVQAVATPIVLVGLACGQLVVAASYSATWGDSFAQMRELRVGAPVSVATPLTPLSAEQVAAVAKLPSVTALGEVSVSDIEFGSEAATVVAATTVTVSAIANGAHGLFDGGAAAKVTAPAASERLLPAAATALRFTVTTTGYDDYPRTSVDIIDGNGDLRHIDLEPATPNTGPVESALGTQWTLSGALPTVSSGGGSWRVLAIDIATPAEAHGSSVRAAVTAADATGPITLGTSWSIATPGGGFSSAPELVKDAPGFSASPRDGEVGPVRLLPGAITTNGELAYGRAVVSQPFADAFTVGVGSQLTLQLPGLSEPLDVVVGLVVPAIPGAGTERSVLIDLGAVRAAQLREKPGLPGSDRLWIASTDPQATLGQVRSALPIGVRVETTAGGAAEGLLASASVVLWLGTAGAALLAAIAVAAVAGALLRSRGADVVLLRALGLAGRQQAAIRRRELGGVLGYGLVAGLVAGGIVSALTMSPLARTAVPDPYASIGTPLRLDPLQFGGALLVVAVSLGVILFAYGARVARQSRDLSAREELG